MTDVPMVCPTHGRADKVKTYKQFDGLILCVAESQEPLYREHYPDAEYLVHPDDVIGLIPKREWIVEKIGGDVFMFDDDITSFRDLTSVPGLLEYPKKDEVQKLVNRLFEMATDMGNYLVAFNPVGDVRTYRPTEPFRFTGFAPGHSFGLRKGHGLWWNRDVIQDDWWISALNAYYHRTMVCDMRYGGFQTETFTGTGGRAFERSVERERQGFELLKQHFGSAIQHKKGNKKYGLKHEHQPVLQLPF